MKDYGLGPLVEGKAWFNQNVQQIKKKVIMNVQYYFFVLLGPGGVAKKTTNPTVVRNSPFWIEGWLASNQGHQISTHLKLLSILSIRN